MTEAKKEANKRYHSTMDDIKVRVPKGKRDEYKEQAWSKGYSLQQYIIALIEYDRVNAAIPELNHE